MAATLAQCRVATDLQSVKKMQHPQSTTAQGKPVSFAVANQGT